MKKKNALILSTLIEDVNLSESPYFFLLIYLFLFYCICIFYFLCEGACLLSKKTVHMLYQANYGC